MNGLGINQIEKATETIQVCVSANEKAKLEQAAREAGARSISSFGRAKFVLPEIRRIDRAQATAERRLG